MSYEPVTLGLKFAITVSDLTARDVVVIICQDCHKRWSVAPHAFFARYHPHRKLLDIEKDMKCKRCGCRQMSWYIMRAQGPEFPKLA